MATVSCHAKSPFFNSMASSPNELFVSMLLVMWSGANSPIFGAVL